jgi:hypothetical protein
VLLPMEPASIPGHSERSEESLPASARGRRGAVRWRPAPREILRSARQEAGSAQNDSLLRLICVYSDMRLSSGAKGAFQC